MSGTKKLARCAAALALIAVSISIGAPAAFAQQIKFFQLGRWAGSLLFRYENENRFTPGKRLERSYDEKLNLENQGFFINPYFINFRWSGTLSLLQERLADPIYNYLSKGRFLSQSLAASILPRSSHPLTLFLNHNANRLDLAFAGKSEIDNTSLRMTLDLPQLGLPSRFFAEIRNINDSWQRGTTRFDRDEVQRSLGYNGHKTQKNYFIDVEYDYFTVNNRLYSTQSYTKHDARFHMQRKLGKEQQNLWDSQMTLLYHTGFSNYGRARLRQSFEFQHLPVLSSNFRYVMVSAHSLGRNSLQNSLFGTLNYKLYNSLQASAGASGGFGSSKVGSFSSLSYNAGVNYTKNLFLHGKLQLGYSRMIAETKRETDSSEEDIVSERHVIIGGQPFFLTERNVILSSIRVFDEDTKTIFEEGEARDFTLRAIGDYVEIIINPLGRIQESDVLLIDYRFKTVPTSHFTTDTEIFSSLLSFGMLAFHYNVNTHDVGVISGTQEALPYLGDLQTRTAGAKFFLRGRKIGLLIFGEHKLHHSRLLNYKSREIRNTLNIAPSPSLSFSSSLNYFLIEHLRQNLVVKTLSLYATLRWRPTRDLMLQGFGRYKTREETRRADEAIYEFGGSLERYWKVLRLKVSYEDREWEFGARLIEDRRFIIEVERRF